MRPFEIDSQLKEDSRSFTISRLANLAASAALEAFSLYRSTFQLITRRGQQRFERRDWLRDTAGRRRTTGAVHENRQRACHRIAWLARPPHRAETGLGQHESRLLWTN